MIKLRLPFVLQCLVFLVPVNIYVIGDWMANGIQWALFRYEHSSIGYSLICIGNDLQYLHWGILDGKSGVATAIWSIAGCLLIACLLVNLSTLQKQTPLYRKLTAIGTIVAGLLFVVSDLVQYGVFLHGLSGFSIPVGVPFILFAGWWSFRDAQTLEENPEPDMEILENENLQMLNITIPRINKTRVMNELALLIFISILVKIIIFSISNFSSYQMMQTDVKWYYHYVLSATQGEIPYIDIAVEYPQFFFIPVFMAVIPTLIIPGYTTFSVCFMLLMYLLDIASLFCVYFIAIRLYGAEKAFLPTLLYATAFSAVFLVPLTYDIVPSFLLVLSILFFIYAKETAAYGMATAGVLTKWFPIFCFPYYVLHTYKNGNETIKLKKGIIISSILVAVSIIPFIFLNFKIFVKSYLIHLNRGPDGHSFIYYLNAVSQYFFNIQPRQSFSLILLIIGECALIFWYFKYLNGDNHTLCSMICLSLFFFVLVNKVGSPQYIIWVTPLLALLFIHSRKQIILFYLLQGIVYLEQPVLHGIVYTVKENGYAVLVNSQPSISFLFFSIKFVVFFIVLFIILRNVKNRRGASILGFL